MSHLVARQAGRGVRPRLRREVRRLVQSAARRRRPAARRRRSPSARSPAASATAARPTTAPPTTSSASGPRSCGRHGPRRAPSRSTGRRGPTSAWRRAARSRQMMAAAGIDMLPPDDGIPIVRRELTAGGTRGEVVIGGPPRRAARRVGRDRRPRPASGRRRARAAGPMIGPVVGMGVHTGLAVETTLDPRAAVPRRPPHRRHPRASRRHGDRGVRGAGDAARARAGTCAPSRTCASSRRSSSTATSRARVALEVALRGRTATDSSPTAGSSAAARFPARRRRR